MGVQYNLATGELIEYTPGPPTLAEMRASLFQQVRAEQSSRFLAGWTHEFSVGTHTLDLRDADDKVNWTLLLIRTQGLNAVGAGTTPITIRTAANEQIVISASEAFVALSEFLSWGEAMLKRKWDLDTEIDAAGEATIDAIDPTSGWPT